MCVEFAYHSTSVLAILDFQDSLDLSLDGGLLEMQRKLSFLAFFEAQVHHGHLSAVLVYLFQASLSSSLEIFVLFQLRGWQMELLACTLDE